MIKKTLILGIGNPMLSDEGIGVHLVNEFMKKNTFPKCTYLTDYLISLDLLMKINGYTQLFVINAVKAGKKPPGSLYVFDINDYAGTLHLQNYHDIGLKQLIMLGKKLGILMPETIQIIGVEIEQEYCFDSAFSSIIEDQYQDILARVSTLIKDYINLLAK